MSTVCRMALQVRDFLMTRIGELRQPKTNIQNQQEYVLMKNKYVRARVVIACAAIGFVKCELLVCTMSSQLMQFLQDHAPQLAAEIKQTYIEIMGRVLKVCAIHSCGLVAGHVNCLSYMLKFTVPCAVIAEHVQGLPHRACKGAQLSVSLVVIAVIDVCSP